MEASNPLEIDEGLLKYSNAPYYHLYAVSICLIELGGVSAKEKVPDPDTTFNCLDKEIEVDKIVEVAGIGLNKAFRAAREKQIKDKEEFSRNQWIKSSSTVYDIQSSLLTALEALFHGKRKLYDEIKKKLKQSNNECFEDKWNTE